MQNTQVLARLANAGCICAGIAGQKNRSEREREREPTLKICEHLDGFGPALDQLATVFLEVCI